MTDSKNANGSSADPGSGRSSGQASGQGSGQGSRRSAGLRRFRPTLWASVCTALAVLMLLGLGTWQLQRLQWKDSLIAERLARSQAPARSLPGTFEDSAALEFVRVRLEGGFLHDDELYVASRTFKGKVGLHVVTPFALDDGRVLLVNRGWVPVDRSDPTARIEGQIEEPQALEVILRRGGWRGWDFTRPRNDPVNNLWLWFDLPAMANRATAENVITEVYGEVLPDGLGGEVPGGLPIPIGARVDLRNNHLEYALTWYTLAVALLVIYVVFSTKRGGERSSRRRRRSRR